MSGSTDKQLWVGNIPQWFDEATAIEEMGLYKVKPYKLILRTRPGADSWGIAYFASPELAAVAKTTTVTFSNGSRALFRHPYKSG